MSLLQLSLQFTNNNSELVEKVQTKHNLWNPVEALSPHILHILLFFLFFSLIYISERITESI